MELTGKLKEDVAKCETLNEAKKKIEEAGVILNDDELDAVAGGGGFLRQRMTTNNSSMGSMIGKTKEFF